MCTYSFKTFFVYRQVVSQVMSGKCGYNVSRHDKGANNFKVWIQMNVKNNDVILIISAMEKRQSRTHWKTENEKENETKTQTAKEREN